MGPWSLSKVDARRGGETERERETWVRLKTLVAGKRDQKVFIRPPFHNLFLCTSDGDTLWRLAASTKRILFLFAAVPATNPTNEPGQIMFVPSSLCLSLSLSLSLLSFFTDQWFLWFVFQLRIREKLSWWRIERINNKRKNGGRW